MRPIIRVENLGKQYRIGARRAPYQTLRESLTDAARAPLRWWRGERRPTEDTIWALKDVNLEVRPGEVVGIIGRNGAGKSTLLKLLSRITEPTTGQVELYGRVGSLLEVGTGFHPELTGRENIYLNGAILGMRRREIERQFDAIVAFAEVEKFLDTPVKHYSSGMYMRLAFAVAAHLEPEILVVDEVLAVGDAEFQKKCLSKMGEVAGQGRTVLFVSHNMAAVQKLCPRCVLLDRGRVAQDGPSAEVIRFYMGAMEQDCGIFTPASRTQKPRSVEVVDAWLENQGFRTGSLMFGDRPSVFLTVDIKEPCTFAVELLLRQENGIPVAFAPSGLAKSWEIAGKPGRLTVRCDLPAARYACGRYAVDLILAISGTAFLDNVESALAFEIESAALGERNWRFTQQRGQGFLLWNVDFSIVGEQASSYVAD